MLLLPAALQLGIGRDPGAQVVLQQQDLLLEVGGQGGRRGHDAPSAAGTAGRASIHSASRRKNWPGAASGSGRRSMMAPRLPGSCGTSTQIACGRRSARSAQRLSRARWPYRASGASSVSSSGRVPSGAARRGRVDRGLDGGQAALDERGQAGRVPAARLGGVGRLDQVPGQAHRLGLGAHRLDQHLRHVDLPRRPAGW